MSLKFCSRSVWFILHEIYTHNLHHNILYKDNNKIQTVLNTYANIHAVTYNIITETTCYSKQYTYYTTLVDRYHMDGLFQNSVQEKWQCDS